MQPNNPYQPSQSPVTPGQNGGLSPDYNFITNPTPPPRKGLQLGQQSLLVKIVIASVGVLLVLVVFAIIKGVVSGGGDTADLTTVAQQQQAIVHVASIAYEQDGISTTTANSSITIETTVGSAQQQVLAYAKNQGETIKNKVLNLKVSKATDTQLKTSAAAGTYDQTYSSVMSTQLDAYKQTLKQAYDQTSGVKGKAMLKNQFNEVQLLQQQLNAPAN